MSRQNLCFIDVHTCVEVRCIQTTMYHKCVVENYIFEKSRRFSDNERCRNRLDHIISIIIVCRLYNMIHFVDPRPFQIVRLIVRIALAWNMCYVIITAGSLGWFIVTLATSMLLMTALVTPRWLIGSETYTQTEYNFTIYRNPSVGINTRYTLFGLLIVSAIHSEATIWLCSRCILMTVPQQRYHCGTFDLEGFATDSDVFPTPWKAALLFQSAAVLLMALSTVCTLITCCRQSVLGKSIHNCTGSAQVFAGLCVVIAIFFHALGWSATRVRRLCGPDAEPFYAGECSIGICKHLPFDRREIQHQ